MTRTRSSAFSAGGVVYRVVDGRIEVVLVGRSAQGLWALPKGTPEPGETPEETARREVSEETGLQVEIVEPIDSIYYSYAVRESDLMIDKEVRHFLMRPTGGDVAFHDHEYDRVEWFELGLAIRLMTYPNEARVVERAAPLIRALVEAEVASTPSAQLSGGGEQGSGSA